MEETIFEKIIKREIPAHIIYEDKKHIAFLDISPFEKGHTLVVPKKPYETIFEMPEEEFLELMKIIRKVAFNLKEKLNCGLNIWQNNKKIAGQEVPHIHFHLVPRKESKKTYCLENKTKYLKNEAESFAKFLKMN